MTGRCHPDPRERAASMIRVALGDILALRETGQVCRPVAELPMVCAVRA